MFGNHFENNHKNNLLFGLHEKILIFHVGAMVVTASSRQ
jgi:hypothetical protein